MLRDGRGTSKSEHALLRILIERTLVAFGQRELTDRRILYWIERVLAKRATERSEERLPQFQ